MSLPQFFSSSNVKEFLIFHGLNFNKEYHELLIDKIKGFSNQNNIKNEIDNNNVRLGNNENKINKYHLKGNLTFDIRELDKLSISQKEQYVFSLMNESYKNFPKEDNEVKLEDLLNVTISQKNLLVIDPENKRIRNPITIIQKKQLIKKKNSSDKDKNGNEDIRQVKVNKLSIHELLGTPINPSIKTKEDILNLPPNINNEKPTQNKFKFQIKNSKKHPLKSIQKDSFILDKLNESGEIVASSRNIIEEKETFKNEKEKLDHKNSILSNIIEANSSKQSNFNKEKEQKLQKISFQNAKNSKKCIQLSKNNIKINKDEIFNQYNNHSPLLMICNNHHSNLNKGTHEINEQVNKNCNNYFESQGIDKNKKKHLNCNNRKNDNVEMKKESANIQKENGVKNPYKDSNMHGIKNNIKAKSVLKSRQINNNNHFYSIQEKASNDDSFDRCNKGNNNIKSVYKDNKNYLTEQKVLSKKKLTKKANSSESLVRHDNLLNPLDFRKNRKGDQKANNQVLKESNLISKNSKQNISYLCPINRVVSERRNKSPKQYQNKNIRNNTSVSYDSSHALSSNNKASKNMFNLQVIKRVVEGQGPSLKNANRFRLKYQ